MKKIVTVLFLIVCFSFSYGQSLRIGPSFGLNKAQDLSFSDLGNTFDISFDNEFHYGFKAKLDLPAISLAASLHKVTFTNGIFERDFLSVAVGPEFKLIPGPVSPYLAADLLFTSYNLSIGLPSDFENDAIGLGFGAGIDFKLLPQIDVDLSIKYQLNNIIGKEDNEESFNTLNVSAAILFSIL